MSKRAWVSIAFGFVTVAVVFGISGGASAGPNPPGNNGTVKVDAEAFDDHPDNEPHVGCIFQIDFYGYDAGELFADVKFEMQSPTGPTVVLLTDKVFIGEDTTPEAGARRDWTRRRRTR